MSVILVAGLLLGSPVAGETHQTQVDHRGQRVDVTYRSAVDVRHRQVGAAGAAGRPSSLRCQWTAKMSVQREARGADRVLARTISSDTPITGSRPGWCEGQRGAIASEVASRGAGVREHLLAVAEEDRDALAAELDLHHGPARS